MNGVCVRWKGWLDLERLDGVGCLEYDEERGQMEDANLREQMERYNSRMRELEERQRIFKAAQERQAEAEAEVSSFKVASFSHLTETGRHSCNSHCNAKPIYVQLNNLIERE